MCDSGTDQKETFHRKLRDEWKIMWNEAFNDKVRAEAVATSNYPLILVDRGRVLSANRDARPYTFREILDYWGNRGLIYSPAPAVGGWHKFIRAYLKEGHARIKAFRVEKGSVENLRIRRKKGGRGWLHKG